MANPRFKAYRNFYLEIDNERWKPYSLKEKIYSIGLPPSVNLIPGVPGNVALPIMVKGLLESMDDNPEEKTYVKEIMAKASYEAHRLGLQALDEPNETKRNRRLQEYRTLAALILEVKEACNL